MNRHITFLTTLMLTFGLISSCSKSNDTKPPIDPIDQVITIIPIASIVNPIRFDSLAIGQKSRYLGFDNVAACAVSGPTYPYSNDTLVLEIVGQDANGYKVAESLHYVGSVNPVFGQDPASVYYYYMKVEDDSLHLAPFNMSYVSSRLFSYYKRSDGFYLVPLMGTQVSISGWKTSLPCCSCWQHGFIKNYKLLGQTFPYLNVLKHDENMGIDWPGHTYLYSAKNGIVKCTEYPADFITGGFGWDLLPD